MASLNDIPNELLHYICANLAPPPTPGRLPADWTPNKDAGSFRLVSKRFNGIGAWYVLQEVKFYTTEADFEMLRAIANNPATKQCVRSLVYLTDMLPARRPEYKEYSKYVLKKCQLELRGQNINSVHLKLAPKGLDLSALYEGCLMTLLRTCLCFKNVNTDTSRLLEFEHDIEKAHNRRMQLVDWQAQTLELGTDRKFLEEVIPAFSNLLHVTVASELGEGFEWLNGQRQRTGRYEGRILMKKARCTLAPPHSPYVDCDERPVHTHAPAILSALRNSSIILDTLRISGVDYTILREFGIQEIDQAMVRLCAGFSEFELYTYIPTMPGSDSPSDATIEECDDIMATGILRKMLRAMPKLAKLRLWMGTLEDDPYTASLSHIIEPRFHWSQLHRIELHGVQFHQAVLLNFIHRHRDSLKSQPDNFVHLADLKLVESSWLVFLPRLRQLVQGTGIDMWLTGSAFGKEEDSGEVEQEFSDLEDDNGEAGEEFSDPEEDKGEAGEEFTDLEEDSGAAEEEFSDPEEDNGGAEEEVSDLEQDSEDAGVESWDLGFPEFENFEQRHGWDGSRRSLAYEVAEYIRGETDECPLSRDNMWSWAH